MFQKDDEKYLVRLLGRNQVVLFLGAGFPKNAVNNLGEPFPLGKDLGEKFWKFLGQNGDYDETPLAEMYQAFLGSSVKRESKKLFLENNLMCKSFPDIYDFISIPFWYKIYQVNIDNLLDKIYRKNGRNLQNLIFPNDEYGERDQSLDSTQVVYLHGKLPCNPDEVIFSIKQYAKAQLTHQPLYAQFVLDYAVKPTIFVGTSLNEQILESYIEAREGKAGYAELRPRSFLIAPSLSPIKADNLKNLYNVHFVEGNTGDFLAWLNRIRSELPSRSEILQNTFPNLLSIQSIANILNVSSKSVNEFAAAFKRIPNGPTGSEERSAYLLGTSPTWNDLFRDRDIPRTITDDVYFAIEDDYAKTEKSEKISVHTLQGTAGSGKSTILMRLGLQLSQNGRTTFICYSEFIPKIDQITDVLSVIKERVTILFDNSNNASSQLKQLLKAFNELEFPPILVLAARPSNFDKINLHLDPEVVDHKQYAIPDLDDREISDLIEKLDENNLLGALKGMTPQNRHKEFKYKARKQILVAMKETTNGRSFNDIIRDEFESISPEEARILCVCVALNTEIGFTNTRQDFVGFSKVTHIEALNYLKENLKGTMLWVGDKEKFMIRHRILADFMIKHCASSDMLKEAYTRVLSILAPELKGTHAYSRKFALYKSLVNHKILYRRFSSDIEKAREVYDSISDFFNDDAHFWLQYGSLEIEGKGGDLTLAENYLNQAESLNPRSHFVKNAKCSLYYKQSSAADEFSVATEYKSKADDLAEKLMSSTGLDDPHTHHIVCRGLYYFIDKWVLDLQQRKDQFFALRTRIENSIRLFPRDKKLEQALSAVTRAYLQLGLKVADQQSHDLDD